MPHSNHIAWNKQMRLVAAQHSAAAMLGQHSASRDLRGLCGEQGVRAPSQHMRLAVAPRPCGCVH